MSTLARMEPAGAAQPYGSRATVPYGCGNVFAQAILAKSDPHTGRPVYAVRIANNSQHTLRAAIKFGSKSHAPSSELDVAPFSIVESLVPHGALTRPDDRAIVEIGGTNLAFTIDAPPATSSGRIVVRRAAMFAGVIAGIGSVALAIATFFIHHATAPLPKPITMASPPAAHAREQSVARRASSAQNFVHIGKASIVAGGMLGVSYVPSTNGDIWLLDDRGRVWGHRRTNTRGRTFLAIPESAAGHDLRVVVGTTMPSGEVRQAASTIAIVPDSGNLAPLDQDAPTSSVHVASTSVNSGKLIALKFAPKHGEALISITDQGGTIVDQLDVDANAPQATLRAPAVGAPTTYDVVVSIASGNAQDQSIIPIVVRP